MTRTMLDAATLVVFGVAAGGAGWWCRATVDDWRMRKLLARIHAEVVAHH